MSKEEFSLNPEDSQYHQPTEKDEHISGLKRGNASDAGQEINQAEIELSLSEPFARNDWESRQKKVNKTEKDPEKERRNKIQLEMRRNADEDGSPHEQVGYNR